MQVMQECVVLSDKVFVYLQPFVWRDELFLFRIIIDRDDEKYNYSIVNLIADNLRYRKYNIDYINNKIWYVIRPEVTQKNKEYNADYYLNVNDMIKIGKVQYVVKEIHLIKGKYLILFIKLRRIVI